MAIAIRGFGCLAGPCGMLFGPDQVKLMFEDVAQRSEQLYFSNDQVVRQVASVCISNGPTKPWCKFQTTLTPWQAFCVSCPRFAEAMIVVLCVSSIFFQISDTYLLLLERMVLLLFDNFSKIMIKLVRLASTCKAWSSRPTAPIQLHGPIARVHSPVPQVCCPRGILWPHHLSGMTWLLNSKRKSQPSG